ncbi:MAG: NAD(+) synthase [Candidatus Sabulitectum sp.]|nr:NAD(+) synthase [Candidatus Sabulitectum sp.]
MTSRGVYAELTERITGWIKERVHGAGMSGVVIGLSGGIDSGVTAALCALALGPENVLGLVMPCESISDDTRDGHKTAQHLGISVKEIDLSGVLGVFTVAGNLDTADILNLANIKARLRMTMEYAHSGNRLVVGTGNLSETKTGYWTKWGDGAADFLPIADLWKDEVRELARYLELPEWMVERVPSAGLWLNQSDEDEMGVTYNEIKNYFARGTGNVSVEAAERITQLHASSTHKRELIPFYHARGWLDERQ